jgi:hypothetical protein
VGVNGTFQDKIGIADRLLDSPAILPEQLIWLERIFAQHNQLDKLSELLWLHKETAFRDLFVVGFFMRLSNKVGLYEQFAPRLRSLLENPANPPHFTEEAHLLYFHDLTADQKADFVRAKYMTWPGASSTDFLTAIDEFVSFAQVSRPLAAFLYERRRDTAIPFHDWLRDVRTAEVIKHISLDHIQLKLISHTDLDQVPKLPPIWEMMDLDAAKFFFATLDASEGLLLGTFHGGYLGLAQHCFMLLMDDHYMLRGNAVRSNDIRAQGDQQLAGFQAVKALAGRKVVLMAPDGPAIRQSSTIEILGVPVKFANGASTIAFEANCRTGWYTVLRDGDRFVPVYEEGPRRLPGQNLVEFTAAWWQFYARQIQNIFTGNPRNISLCNRWPRTFRNARV